MLFTDRCLIHRLHLKRILLSKSATFWGGWKQQSTIFLQKNVAILFFFFFLSGFILFPWFGCRRGCCFVADAISIHICSATACGQICLVRVLRWAHLWQLFLTIAQMCQCSMLSTFMTIISDCCPNVSMFYVENICDNFLDCCPNVSVFYVENICDNCLWLLPKYVTVLCWSCFYIKSQNSVQVCQLCVITLMSNVSEFCRHMSQFVFEQLIKNFSEYRPDMAPEM